MIGFLPGPLTHNLPHQSVSLSMLFPNDHPDLARVGACGAKIQVPD